MKYAEVLEKGESSYGAFVPDLPGCIAVAEDREQTLRLLKEAVAFHVEGLRAQGLPAPRQPPAGSCSRAHSSCGGVSAGARARRA